MTVLASSLYPVLPGPCLGRRSIVVPEWHVVPLLIMHNLVNIAAADQTVALTCNQLNSGIAEMLTDFVLLAATDIVHALTLPLVFYALPMYSGFLFCTEIIHQ